jgi:hypothetical protein
MRTSMHHRWVSSLTIAAYLLAITAASLFHNHAVRDGGRCCHEDALAHKTSADHDRGDSSHSHAPGVPSQCPDDENCSACQFLAHKPAPITPAAATDAGTLIEEAFTPSPARVVAGVFSAWQSRGPPTFA